MAALRDLTRDSSRFPLVAEEVADYGFRRNWLGLRPIALIIAALVVVTSVAVLIAGNDPHPTRFIVPAAAGVVALLGWTFGVQPQWVRSSADLYAARLLEATETLGRERAGSTRTREPRASSTRPSSGRARGPAAHRGGGGHPGRARRIDLTSSLLCGDP